MTQPNSSNVSVKPNVWCDPGQPETDIVPYFLQSIIPGDLLVHFLGSRDVREIQHHLTPRQRLEYEQSRFFQPHGQEGTAFEPS